MDFIDGLPKSQGKTVLLVVVDRFSKYAHFLPLAHPYTAPTVARVFFDNIVRLHGLPESIVSDRDVIFTSNFWKELFRLYGTKLAFTSAYHPQSDGQTEVVNRTIEMYLRCFAGDKPKDWANWISWAEFCYNTSFHTALRTTPFKVVYGRDPPRLIAYTPDSTKVDAVDQDLIHRDQALALIRQQLFQAQQRMKVAYDKNHRDIEFEIGSLVWLRLYPYRLNSLVGQSFHKLSPKFYGPFEILQRIGSVAYHLALPSDCKLHDVFHVSRLKPFRGPLPISPPKLPPLAEGQVVLSPSSILRSRLNRGTWEILVQWQGFPPEDAT